MNWAGITVISGLIAIGVAVGPIGILVVAVLLAGLAWRS